MFVDVVRAKGFAYGACVGEDVDHAVGFPKGGAHEFVVNRGRHVNAAPGNPLALDRGRGQPFPPTKLDCNKGTARRRTVTRTELDINKYFGSQSPCSTNDVRKTKEAIGSVRGPSAA